MITDAPTAAFCGEKELIEGLWALVVNAKSNMQHVTIECKIGFFIFHWNLKIADIIIKASFLHIPIYRPDHKCLIISRL